MIREARHCGLPSRAFGLAALLLCLFAPPRAARAAYVVDTGVPSDAGPQITYIRFNEPVAHHAHDRIVESGYFYVDFHDITRGLPEREWKVDRNGVFLIRRMYYRPEKVLRFIFYSDRRLTTRIDFDAGGSEFSVSSHRIRPRAIDLSGPIPEKNGDAKIVFIDPGHGGKSSGAMTSRRIRGRHYEEKDIVLDLASRMVPLFEHSPNLELRVSRNRDNYVSLEDRILMSQIAESDIFVSLHLNATDSRKKTARGFEVYYLGDGSRTTERWIEQMENRSNGSLSNRDSRTLRRILKDLDDQKMRERKEESRALGYTFNRVFLNDGPFRRHNRGVKTGAFRVLVNYQVPAVLVECGFLDHPDDARLVLSSQGQNQIAALLFNAINLYFARVDPEFEPHIAPVPQ